MNKLEVLLKKAAGKRSISMCHLVAGFPTREDSEAIALSLIESGADILEIQVPFSDPMADGPSIATACQDALKDGASTESTLALVKKVSGKAPIAIMSYLNPIYRYGIDKFVHDAARAGASALIVPDAPFDTEEGKALLHAAKENNLCMIPVVSPGVPKARIKELAKSARGFVYCTSRQGTTGANGKFLSDLKAYMQSVRAAAKLPLGLGFGVRTRADYKHATELADIVIAGSVFVNAIRKGGNPAYVVRTAAKELLN